MKNLLKLQKLVSQPTSNSPLTAFDFTGFKTLINMQNYPPGSRAGRQTKPLFADSSINLLRQKQSSVSQRNIFTVQNLSS